MLSANQSSRESMTGRDTSTLHHTSNLQFPILCVSLSSLIVHLVRQTMAVNLRPASRLAARPLSASTILRQAHTPSPLLRATATSQFHTSSTRRATPSGPPPPGFRLPKPKRFDEGENVYDKASNYFLLTEMFRGMYVVLEQFFRPP